MENEVIFECVPWKMSGFISFLLLGSTLVIKLRSFDFETHWNTLLFYDVH